MWGFGDLIDSLDGLAPVVGGGLVQQQTLSRRGKTVGEGNRQTHYWALRQQAQRDLRSTEKGVAGRACPVGGQAVAVVALLWWWGVVFDLWIVVASI